MSEAAPTRWVRRRRAGTMVLVGLVSPLVGASTVHAQTQTDDPAAVATFAEKPVGAAASVTGGAGGVIRLVSNLKDDGPGSLRVAAEQPGPAVIVFGVSGQVVLRKPIAVASDLTIDGRGADFAIVGKGLTVEGSNNVIIRNLKVRGNSDSDSNDDAVAILGGAKGVWIDHLDLTGFEDGLIDVTQLATNVTLSWNRLTDHGKAMLLGSNVREGAPEYVDVTVHHNFLKNTGERNPMVRQARAHVFNNVLHSWGYAAESGYGMRSDCGGIVLVEANIFRPGANPRATTARNTDCDAARPPALKVIGNDLGGADSEEARTTSVFDLGAAQASPEAIGPSLASRVETDAGWQNVTNPIPIPTLEESTKASNVPTAAAGPDEGAPAPKKAGNSVVVLVLGALTGGVILGLLISRLRRTRPRF